MSKALEELILGEENRAAVSAAVRRAVARAAAAGLQPAYETVPCPTVGGKEASGALPVLVSSRDS